jgi:hypothetical protein
MGGAHIVAERVKDQGQAVGLPRQPEGSNVRQPPLHKALLLLPLACMAA